MKVEKTEAPEKLRLHRFDVTGIDGVDYMAQPPARAVLIKRGDKDFEKVAFEDALTALDLGDAVQAAVSRVFRLTDALQMSVREVIEDRDEYPNPKQAVQDSLRGFANEIIQVAAGAVDGIDADDSIFKRYTKEEDGEEFPARDFAYTPELVKSDSWALRLTSVPGGLPDAQLVDAAIEHVGTDLFKASAKEATTVKRRLRAAFKKANPGKDLPEFFADIEEATKVMKKEENAPTAEQVTALEKRAEKAEALATLTDVQKSHYNGLDEAGKESFLKMDADARTQVIEKAAGDDPVEYTTISGRELRKSAGVDMIEAAKETDIEKRANTKLRAEIYEGKIEKRLGEKLSHLPGDTAARTALVKAVDGIKDEELRKSVFETVLQPHDAGMATILTKRGTTEGNGSLPDTDAQLDKMATELAKSESITFEKAYTQVLESPEGAALYQEKNVVRAD